MQVTYTNELAEIVSKLDESETVSESDLIKLTDDGFELLRKISSKGFDTGGLPIATHYP